MESTEDPGSAPVEGAQPRRMYGSLYQLLARMGRGKTEEGVTRKQALATRLWEQALKGDLRAARLIMEYLIGKPVQRVEAGETPGLPAFTADEAAEAERQLRAWQQALEPADGEAASEGGAD